MTEVTQAVGALGSVVNGSASYAAGKYNKRLSYENARQAESEGAAEVARIREVARAAIGGQVAAQGASGFQMGTGSALDALTESQINATMDALNARREAQSRAQGLRVQGNQAMSAGKNAYTAGLLQSASTVLENKADWSSARSGKAAPKGASADIVVNQSAVSRAFAKAPGYGY